MTAKSTIIGEPAILLPTTYASDTWKWPFSSASLENGYFLVAWKQSHVVEGRQSGLTHYRAIGPQGKALDNDDLWLRFLAVLRGLPVNQPGRTTTRQLQPPSSSTDPKKENSFQCHISDQKWTFSGGASDPFK